jgi:hypothetical protein
LTPRGEVRIFRGEEKHMPRTIEEDDDRMFKWVKRFAFAWVSFLILGGVTLLAVVVYAAVRLIP